MVKIRTTLLALLIVTIQAGWLHGQQLPVYSQYTFNKFLLNPAAAGSDGYTTINLVAREQWVGFEGTPKTHAIMIDSRLLRNSFISKNASVRRKKGIIPVQVELAGLHMPIMIIREHLTGLVWKVHMLIISRWVRDNCHSDFPACFISSDSTRIK